MSRPATANEVARGKDPDTFDIPFRAVCEECGAIFEGELAEAQSLRLEEHHKLHFETERRDPAGDLLEAFSIPTSKTFRDQLGVFLQAMRIYADRHERYGDKWRRYGWLDSFFHIRNKYLRIESEYWDRDPTDQEALKLIDNPYDLLNYVAFFIRNIVDQNRKGTHHG